MKSVYIYIIAVAIIFSLNSCDKDKTHDVRYSVNSSNTVDVTYQNKNGGTSQESSVSSGWSYSFTGMSDDFVYISAQNNGDNGSVEVTIYVDGDEFKTSQSSGAYVIATADGTL